MKTTKIIKTYILALLIALLIIPSAEAASLNWLVEIGAYKGTESSKVKFGGEGDASDGLDGSHDAVRRFTLNSPLKAYMLPGWNLPSPYAWVDIRSLTFSQEYTFFVESTYINQDFQLIWKFIKVPDAVNLSLFDDVAGITTDLKAVSKYGYKNTDSSPRKFILTVTGPTDVDGPVINATANPAVIPSGTFGGIPVTISGTVSDDLSGVKSLTYHVTDNTGNTNENGVITVDSDGSFSIDVVMSSAMPSLAFKNEVTGTVYEALLLAETQQYSNGKIYAITFTAEDNAGNITTGSIKVSAP